MSKTNIEWCDWSFNPVIGCTKVSAACAFCYAEEYANRYEPLVTWGKPGQKSVLRRTVPSNWRKPIAWNNAAAKAGTRRRVFCASLADVFDNNWEEQTRADLWNLIGATRHLDWLLLTKRPQNIARMLPGSWGDGWKNVWLGITAENQEEYDRRRLQLLSIPATVHFFSVEPMLTLVIRDIASEHGKNVWYICGGESGANRRPFNLEWAEALRSSCAETKTPFFFKQDSSHKPGCRGRASDDLWACKQFPEAA